MFKKAIIKNKTNNSFASGNYIPEYDLFRALAITLVVFYHYFSNKIQSGFIGVDIFFTLSGCVISKSIISEISKNGSFSVAKFYKKRVLRIFPNICLYIFLTLILMIFSGDLDSIKNISNDIFRTLFFISNLSVNNPNDYFSINDGGFFNIFWSLSIEEQFYFLLPFIIALSLFFSAKVFPKDKISKKQFNYNYFVNIFSIVIFIITVFSLIYLSKNISDISFHYANSFSRFWQISLGILITLLSTKIHIKSDIHKAFILNNLFLKRVFLYIPIILLIFISFQPISKLTYPNHYSILISLITFLGLTFSPGAIINKNNKYLTPFFFVGKISYGWYLWHWLVLESCRYYSISVSSPFTRLILLSISFLLTILIYKFFEMPLRFNKSHNLHIFLSIIYLFLSFPVIILNSLSENLSIANNQQKEINKKYSIENSLKKFLIKNDYRSKLIMDCDFYEFKLKNKKKSNSFSFMDENCSNKNSKELTNKLRVGFLGDSHAQQFINSFSKKDNYIYPLIGSGCLPEAILDISNNEKNYCKDLGEYIFSKDRLRSLNIIVISFDIIQNRKLVYNLISKLNKEYKDLKIILVGPVPRWENYLPKIAIRNLRGNVKDVYSNLSLNKSNLYHEEILKNDITKFNSPEIFYFSIIDILCQGSIEKKCLVGFSNKEGSISLTSYDKSHLTLETSEEIIRPEFEGFIKSLF